MESPLAKREREAKLSLHNKRLALSLVSVLIIVVLATLAFAHFLVR